MLEQELGGALFERQRRNIRLSELGRAVAPFLESLSWCEQSAKRRAAEVRKLHRSEMPALGLGDQEVTEHLDPRDALELLGIDEIRVKRDRIRFAE